MRLKMATYIRFVTCFRDVAAVLEQSREYRISKLDITKRTTFNDDHYILCIAVCTCYRVHPLYMVDFIHLYNFN